jgi:MraZ protein
MSSFKGSYLYSVDSKGRVNIPAKLRKHVSTEANDNFVLTRGYERCLFIYPQDEWQRLEQSIRQLSGTNPKHRFFIRTLCQHASEVQLDGQSRITIPRELLEFSGIESDVKIIGVLERIELWNPRQFEEYQQAQSESYEVVAQTVFQQ